MAIIKVAGKHLEVSLNARESRLLSRTNFKLELGRISGASLGSGLGNLDLGTKVSRSSIFSGYLGEYRSGSKRVMVLGTSRAGKHVTISVLHPTIDQIIYCEKDAEALYESLTKKR